MASVKEGRDFNPEIDAQDLKEAMKGLGTDEKAIIDILAYRTSAQKLRISESFKSQFGQDLKKELHSELSGRFRQSVLWSFGDGPYVNACALFKAIDRPGTDEEMLVDVLCTSNNQEIKAIKQAYQQVLKENKKDAALRNLEEDVRKDTSGNFQKILVALIQAAREETCDPTQARQDCSDLYEGGEARMGTEEAIFTRIFVTRSWPQLRMINDMYAEEYGHDVIKAISNETSRDYKLALTRIMKTAINLDATVTEMLYKSMKGAGTNDDSLIRIILSHSEHNLARLKDMFDNTYKKTLVQMIEGDTKGDYKKFLLAIVH